MVVKIINGMRIHEPPYTQAEEDEFRVSAGDRLLLRVQLVTVQSRRPPQQRQPSPAKPHRS
jgi:hypothetical protein